MKTVKKEIDKKRIEAAIRELLMAIGENPNREGLKNTPKRVANFYEEFMAGMVSDPSEVLKVYYEEEGYEEIVLLKNIPFYSLCEHHLLPFFGKAHVAYIPKKRRLLGISKIVRLVELVSHKLQLQERVTKHIAETIEKVVKPHGVMVVMEAEHFCFSMRGIKKPGTSVMTSAVRGIFLKDAKARAEALQLINKTQS
ncbi:MAG: GTP cyclohydrolase I FolE [Elusimicrobiota bacterium]